MSPGAPFHVLIIGGGIVGLTIAQGCRQNGISYAVYERDEPGSGRQGWALTLHWCLSALERTIGEERMQGVRRAVVDHTLATDAGNILFLNAATGEVRHRTPPVRNRLRVHRQKLREALSRGVDVRPGKRLASVGVLPGGRGVRATFEDGTAAEGSLLVGADGNNSAVRAHLLPRSHRLNRLPLNLIGAVRHFTPEQAAPVRALDPLLFQALDPGTGSFLWYSVQEVFGGGNPPGEPAGDPTGAGGPPSLDALVLMSWLVRDESADAIPASNAGRVALMKGRAAGFAEPLRSIVMDIPDGAEARPLRMGDFVPPAEGWSDLKGSVTLAGDASHAMTMYRGEGANHGILDAALLVDQLRRIASGAATQEDALDVYETEMRERTARGVLLSRQAALDAHDWGRISDDSPLIGARVAPETAISK